MRVWMLCTASFCLGTLTSHAKDKAEEEVPQGKERHSKLRRHIWENLRRLYDAYVQGRCLTATDAEFRTLIQAIMGELSEA